MWNVNINPIIIIRIPIMILNAENSVNITAIPKNIKLNPIRMVSAAVLKIGKIIKINPKIMDNIPPILFGSIFFSSKILLFPLFQGENIKNSKATSFYIKYISYTI